MSASLGEKIASMNKSYYSEKGKEIYSDFSTFAQGKVLSVCNASEFVRDFSIKQGEIEICEYGVGNGNFAKIFLSEVKRLSPPLYSRMRYHLFDISQKMLSFAKTNLGAHAKLCQFHEFDAGVDQPTQPFDYCRINELLSDLPADFYSRKGMKILNERGMPAISPDPSVLAFLKRVDEGRLIPFSFAAQKFLTSLCDCGKMNFRIDLFDYGFYSAEDLNILPAEEWNRVIVRDYGDQLTADLNFLQLSAALGASGFSAKVERQMEYCEAVMGKKLELSQNARGLDYVPKKKDDGIIEDDGFWHLRVDG
ncbi:MAG: SAM-dependent methyltransferase [Candidatus Micrarchaeota archaeon]|nr:SAM-dependent methyltransferase [Candidatus Micrarchaeota archaeon]